MPRPQQQDRPRRDRWLPKVRATQEELDGIEKRRAMAGVPLSEFLRRQAIEGAIIQRAPLADQQLVRSLGALGNNLNQIARTANITGDLDHRTTSRLRSALDTLEGLIEELIRDR